MAQLFLSYCHEDDALARELVGLLEEDRRGRVRVWRDTELTAGTRSWRDEIARQIMRADALLLLLTQTSSCREEVKREVYFADYCRRRIMVVPVGQIRPTEDNGGLLELVMAQHHAVPQRGSLDRAVIDAIRRGLEAPDSRPAPARERWAFGVFGPLEVAVDEVPPVALQEDDLLLTRIWHEQFRRWVAEGRWEEAALLLKEVVARNVAPKRYEDFARLRDWLAGVAWYEHEVRRGCHSWRELAALLGAEAEGRGPAALVKANPALLRHLRRTWQRAIREHVSALYDSLWRFAEQLPDVAPAEGAARHLEILDPAVAGPLEALLGRDPSRAAPAGLDLRRCAKLTLEACGSGCRPPSRAEGRHDPLQSASPPGNAEIHELMDRARQGGERREALAAFADFVTRWLDGESDQSDAHRFVLRVRDLIAETEKTAAPAGADLLAARNAWTRGLSALPGVRSAAALRQVLPDLEQAAAVFAAAGEHGRLATELAESWERYEELRRHLGPETWPEAAAVLDGYLRATESYLEDLARPAEAWLRSRPAGGDGGAP